MTDPIRLIVSGPGPETGSLHDTVLITPTIARQIVALATSEESSGVSPAAAVDDENAWNAICRVLHPKWDEWMEEAIDFHDGEISDNQRNIRLDAIRLIEAIRRGEVPGLTTTAALDALKEEMLSKDEVDLIAERDSAIARAEKAELEAKAPRGSGWADAQEVRNFKEQIAAAQAAHAEAVRENHNLRRLILDHTTEARVGSWPHAHRVSFCMLAQWNDKNGNIEPYTPLTPSASLDAYLDKHGGGK